MRLFRQSDSSELGSITTESGVMKIHVCDIMLRKQISEISGKTLPYLKDSDTSIMYQTIIEKTEPGSQDHLKILMFELRKIGIESRMIPDSNNTSLERQ